MFDPTNTEQVAERLDALSGYAADIGDLETRTAALKELRDVIISGLVDSGVPSRTIADFAKLSHVRVAAIAKHDVSAA